MIPFFRKIRYRLAQNNQFLKYSRYAIGEIVLVVIGILIALYINNWNEQHKEREKFDQVLIEVENELIANIENARTTLDTYHYIDSLSNIFFFDSLTVEDYKNENNSALRPLGEYYSILTLEVDAYNKLVSYSENINSNQESAVAGLKVLYGSTKKVIDILNQRMTSYTQNLSDSHMKYSWFTDTRRNKYNHNALVHIAADSIHRNKISQFMLIAIGNLASYIEEFEIHGTECYKRIHNYLSNTYSKHSEPIRFSYKANEYSFLVGTYVSTWRANGEVIPGDSTVISVENDTLFYTPYFEGGNSRREIIPVNKSYFRTKFGRGFYQIVYDELGNVERVDHSTALGWSKEKKIR